MRLYFNGEENCLKLQLEWLANEQVLFSQGLLVAIRSIYQYSNMASKLSGQTSIFGGVFFVSKSLLGIGRQKKLKTFTILT